MRFDYRNKTPITEGGEGTIFDYGNSIIKIYKPHVDLASKFNKANALMNMNLPKEVIVPDELVKDNSDKFIGIKMKKVEGEDFKLLSNKKYVRVNNVNTKDVLILLDKFWDILNVLHKNQIYIGDLNDQNALFDIKSKNIYLIDCDSWSVGNEKCTVAMDSFKDPKLVGDNFNEGTDVFAFCVLAWKSLTRVHPFGGTMNPDIQILDRMKNGISVIDNQKVKLPRTTKSWNNLSPDLISAFKDVFESGDRVFGDYIKDLLSNLTYCKKDHDYYYNEYSSCPMCNSKATVVVTAQSIGTENGFKLVPILKADDVKIVLSDGSYLNKNDEIVDIRTGMTVKYNEGRYIFDNAGNVVVCHKDYMMVNNKTKIPIQYASYVESDNGKIYYVSNTNWLSALEVMPDGVGQTKIQQCSLKTVYQITKGYYCIINIYDGRIIINISGYNTSIEFDKIITESAAHYDNILDRWLIILRDNSNNYYSYIIEQNSILWRSDKIPYGCSVQNICFDHGAIYIPVPGAIRGMNYQTLKYKDFTCSVVDTSSKLIKNGGQFRIVNDENIYRFYK